MTKYHINRGIKWEKKGEKIESNNCKKEYKKYDIRS